MQDTPTPQLRPYFMRQASGGFHEGYLTSPYHTIDPNTGNLLLDLHSGPQVNHFQTQAYAGMPTRWGPVVDQSEYGHIPRNRIKSDQLYLHNPRSNRGPFISTSTLDMPIQAFESLPNTRRLASNGLTSSFADSELVYPQNLFQTEEEFKRFYENGKQSFEIALRDLARLLDQERSNPTGEENVRNILKDMEIIRQRQSSFEATMSQLHAAMIARDTATALQAQKEAEALVSKQKQENATTTDEKQDQKQESSKETKQVTIPVYEDGKQIGSLGIGEAPFSTLDDESGLAYDHPRIGGINNIYADEYEQIDFRLRTYRTNYSTMKPNQWLGDVFETKLNEPDISTFIRGWPLPTKEPFIVNYVEQLQKLFERFQRISYQRPDIVLDETAKDVLKLIDGPIWLRITQEYLRNLTLYRIEGTLLAADESFPIDIVDNAIHYIQKKKDNLEKMLQSPL
jgi:hypothetical protein